MSLFLYKQKDNFSHRMDPRTKIVMLLWLFLVASLAADLGTITALFLIILALFLITESMDNLLKMALLFFIIAGVTFVLWAYFYGGDKSDDGQRINYAALMSLRFLCMLLSGLLFLSITSLEDFTNGLMLLKVPYNAAFTVSLSFRLVNVFTSTGFLIVEAQSVRGNDATHGNIIKRIRAYVPLLVPLILNGIKKAETLNLALESKGFSPKNTINISGRYKMTTADKAVVVTLAVSAVVFICCRFLLK